MSIVFTQASGEPMLRKWIDCKNPERVVGCRIGTRRLPNWYFVTELVQSPYRFDTSSLPIWCKYPTDLAHGDYRNCLRTTSEGRQLKIFYFYQSSQTENDNTEMQPFEG